METKEDNIIFIIHCVCAILYFLTMSDPIGNMFNVPLLVTSSIISFRYFKEGSSGLGLIYATSGILCLVNLLKLLK